MNGPFDFRLYRDLVRTLNGPRGAEFSTVTGAAWQGELLVVEVLTASAGKPGCVDVQVTLRPLAPDWPEKEKAHRRKHCETVLHDPSVTPRLAARAREVLAVLNAPPVDVAALTNGFCFLDRVPEEAEGGSLSDPEAPPLAALFGSAGCCLFKNVPEGRYALETNVGWNATQLPFMSPAPRVATSVGRSLKVRTAVEKEDRRRVRLDIEGRYSASLEKLIGNLGRLECALAFSDQRQVVARYEVSAPFSDTVIASRGLACASDTQVEMAFCIRLRE